MEEGLGAPTLGALNNFSFHKTPEHQSTLVFQVNKGKTFYVPFTNQIKTIRDADL